MYLFGEVSVGEVSVGDVPGRGSVRRENVLMKCSHQIHHHASSILHHKNKHVC